MPRKLAVFVTVLALDAVSRLASAQITHPVLFTGAGSASIVQLHGVVKDDGGKVLDGVSVLALGTTLAVATSDAFGRFSLALPPGEYVLRAMRAGYVSTFRELVHIRGDVALEQNITLWRSLVDADASGAGPSAPGPAGELDHAHSEMAWRLRHLPRTVLRDEAPTPMFAPDWRDPDAVRPAPALAAFEPAAAGAESFPGRDLSGEVNLLTSGAIRAASGASAIGAPRGIAYVAVGAPVGPGDWDLRTALAGQGFSSWTLAADYRAHDDEPHVARVGLWYSSQTIAFSDGSLSAVSAAPVSRSVGALDLSDRWHLNPALEIDYGVRLDHYDYLDDQNLASPHLGIRVGLLSRLSLAGSLASERIAPGAEEFLPPASSGPWLPPERTFSPLDPKDRLRPETVRRMDVGLDYDLGAHRTTTVGFRRVSESTGDQLATLFGADDGSAVGHYSVAAPGSVDVEGWSAHVTGRLARFVTGTVEYVKGDAIWRGDGIPPAPLLQALPASGFGRERLDDLRASVEAVIPGTATRVRVAVRADGVTSRGTPAPATALGRFDIELRQALPYRPPGDGRLNLLIAVGNLLRDAGEPGSFYDELLTVAPPARFTCGLQMWF